MSANAATFEINFNQGIWGNIKFDGYDHNSDGRITQDEVTSFSSYLIFGSPGGPSATYLYSASLFLLDFTIGSTIFANARDQISYSTTGYTDTCNGTTGRRDYAIPEGRVDLSKGSASGITYQLGYDQLQNLNDSLYCDGFYGGITPSFTFDDNLSATPIKILGSATSAPAPVPVPGTLPLIGGALGALGLLRRKSRRAPR